MLGKWNKYSYICINSCIIRKFRQEGTSPTKFDVNELYLHLHNNFSITITLSLTCPTRQDNPTNHCFAKQRRHLSIMVTTNAAHTVRDSVICTESPICNIQVIDLVSVKLHKL